MRIVLRLLLSWAAGLAAYAGALVALRGEVLPLDTWRMIGSVTLIAWLLAAAFIILPLHRLLVSPRCVQGRRRLFVLASVAVAVAAVWLTTGFWYGWHPRELLASEVGFLGVHYAISGLVLALSLGPRTGRSSNGAL